MKYTTCAVLSGLVIAGPSFAEEKREAGAHEHGHGAFYMAIEGQKVAIELQTPAFDILGFEYAAKSDAEKEMVTKARDVLSDPVALFGLAADAGCSVTEAKIEVGADEVHHHDDEDHHDDHAEGEDHHDDHAEGEKAEHSEVHAHYTLTCEASDKIATVNLSGYFKAFPNAEELDAAILSDAGQASGEVEPDSPELSL